MQLEDWSIGGGGSVYTYRVTEVERHIEMGSGDNPATTGSVTLILDYGANVVLELGVRRVFDCVILAHWGEMGLLEKRFTPARTTRSHPCHLRG